MALLQNQGSEVPLNVLHDQGIPNTLSRMNPIIPVGQSRFPLAVFLVAVVLVAVLVAMLAARLS
jgi:hypothetical protein